MEFNGLTSSSHMSLLEAGYGSEEGQLGSKISGAVSGVTTPGASRLQASQSQERSATMQRLQGIATANLQIELPESDPKNLPEWGEEFLEFLLLTGQRHADVLTKCTLIKKSCKKQFLQRHVKTAIRKSSSWGDSLKGLEQMYPVWETDLSVRTEIEELFPLLKFPTAARLSEFVAQLEELMGRMNPSSYGPTEPHMWLVGKIPPRTWENCKETSERKSRTHSYDELVDLLIEIAMGRENDSHMDKYLRKHLRMEAPAE